MIYFLLFIFSLSAEEFENQLAVYGGGENILHQVGSPPLTPKGVSTHEQFEVGEAIFEGNRLSLLGSVSWDHPIGSLKAKSAEAAFDAEAKMPEEITMQEGVDITLNDGGIMHAPYAWIGCRQCLAVFHGHEGEKVAYEKEGFLLKSLKAEVHFLSPKMMVERITADGLVEIAMQPDLYLTGNQAVFEHFSPKGVFGRGALLSEAHGSFCKMKQGDHEIHADNAELNMHDQTVVLHQPRGVLKKEALPIHFKASQMTLDKGNESLHLEPPVHIEWLGVLDTLGTVEIRQKEKQLHSVFVQGVADLDWEGHRLTVYDALSIDPILKRVVMSSNGSDPIYFRDPHGEIYADRAELLYDEKQKPLRLILEGNIRLQNTTAGALQYALADEGIFEFEKNTLTLKAKTRPRVLFYDELNKVQASAPGLTINRDPKNGQNVLRGMGNVRFIFAEEELNELKKRFSFEPK